MSCKGRHQHGNHGPVLVALVLALMIVSVLGPSLVSVTAAIALVIIPRSARIIRSVALGIRETEFVTAARAVGCGDLRCILRHVLPNCLAPFIIVAAAQLGEAILVEASLSFLGVGTPPPTPSWGSMISGEGRSFLVQAPWIVAFPGIAVTLAVLSVNFLGDALRDALDPRLRGT